MKAEEKGHEDVTHIKTFIAKRNTVSSLPGAELILLTPGTYISKMIRVSADLFRPCKQ